MTLDGFIAALERFGLHVDGQRRGRGGLQLEVVQALFDKYDYTGAGSISYAEFVRALFAADDDEGTGRAAVRSEPAAAGIRVSKPCFEENAWLKGSNGIFG